MPPRHPPSPVSTLCSLDHCQKPGSSSPPAPMKAKQVLAATLYKWGMGSERHLPLITCGRSQEWFHRFTVSPSSIFKAGGLFLR